MNRRNFTRSLSQAAIAAAALRFNPGSAATAADSLAPAAIGTGAEKTPTARAVFTKQHTADITFKLSVMLWTVFRDLPFEQRLERVAEAGYSNVQLVGEYKKWSEDDFKRATAKRKELGITFDTTAGLKHGVGNPKDHDGLLADLQEALGFMERLECPSIILLSGNVVPGTPREAQHQSCVDGLKKAAALVEGKKIHGEAVQLLLENINPQENPRYYLTSAAEGFEIVRAVNHPQVKFLYDLFHEQVSQGNLIEKLEKNIHLVGGVHVADVPGRHEPGTGEINYENIFRKLGQLKYDGIVAMEFLPTSDPIGKLRSAREMAINAGRP